MRQYLEFSLTKGGSIVVEVDESEAESGIEPAARGSTIVRKVEKSFEEAMESVRVVADSLVSKLSQLSKSPNEIQVEFGLRMNSKVGIVVTSAEIGGNFKITVKWKK